MLRVKDWSAHFENNRTRELKRLDWVPIPNRMDGDGYTDLVDHPNGAAHLGAWIAIVQIASKCDVRGTLSREGARPHDCRSLARISRIPVSVFDEAIPRLLMIGWLEDTDANAEQNQQDTDIPQDAATIPQCDAVIPQDVALKGREGKGIEENGNAPSAPTPSDQTDTRTKPPVTTRNGYGPGAMGDEAWREFRGLGEQYGWQYSEIEWDEANSAWRHLDFTQQLTAVSHLRSLIETGDNTLARSHPKNYIGKGYYIRAVGPPPPSKAKKPMDDYTRELLRRAAAVPEVKQ